MDQNLKAFLTMIGASEGTIYIPGSDDGYRVIVGSTPAKPVLFFDYFDHPRIKVPFDKLNINSTAAGRYQIMAWIFDAYKKQLSLGGFWPDDQDKIAIKLIKECRAMDDIITKGKIEDAVTKCRSRWASLPGAGYGQHEQKMEMLRLAYVQAGGHTA
jgi:muramidase (phage lysozyme)